MDRRVGRSRRARDAHQLLVKQSVIEQGDGDNDLDIERAASLLRSDALVAFPTETVYGLGGNARSTTAISRLYAVKSRPTNHPVIVHLALDAPIDEWAVRVPDWANVLAQSFWPGPLTLVLPKRPDVLDALTGGHPSIGLRVPAQKVAQALLKSFGDGVAAPSANRFGRVSPTSASAVVAELGDEIDFVLDGGACSLGVESTIVDCTKVSPTILRPGGVTREEIISVLGSAVLVKNADGSTPAPGTLSTHYSPQARVVLTTANELSNSINSESRPDSKGKTHIGLLALADDLKYFDQTNSPEVIILNSPINVKQYARVLYESLRTADINNLAVVIAVLPPSSGLGEAVCDRLTRATGRANFGLKSEKIIL